LAHTPVVRKSIYTSEIYKVLYKFNYRELISLRIEKEKLQAERIRLQKLAQLEMDMKDLAEQKHEEAK
jgi:hypothetical protein